MVEPQVAAREIFLEKQPKNANQENYISPVMTYA